MCTRPLVEINLYTRDALPFQWRKDCEGPVILSLCRRARKELVWFPDPPVLRAKEGLVYKVEILGCAESACSENG